VAGPAEPTGAVAEVERDRDVVALRDRLDRLADGEDVPRGFVPEDVARYRVEPPPVPVTPPGVPVAPADATGLDGDDGTLRVGLGRVDLPDVQRFSVVGEDGCAHTPTHGITD
jgi:hypothetical protein